MKAVLRTVALTGLVVVLALLIERGFSPDYFDEGRREYDSGNYEAAIDLWKPLAENGDTASQVALANMYRCGTGAPMNQCSAIAWYELAAAHGDASAQRWLSTYLLHGICGRRDEQRAIELLQTAAEQGNADAQYILSRWFLGDLYVERDDAVSLMWLMRAAAQDHPEAQYQLSLSYIRGDGVERDLDQNVRWSRRSADNGHVPAMTQLANVYRHGHGDLSVDYKRAMALYQMAIEMGSDYNVQRARHQLGTMFALGEGVVENHEEACRLFEIAAEGGNHEAMFDAGVCYEEGKGGTRDLIQAYRWYSVVIVNAEANLEWFRSFGDDGEYIATRHTDQLILNRVRERFDALNQVLTPGELAKAEALANKWQIAYQEKLDQKRKGRIRALNSC